MIVRSPGRESRRSGQRRRFVANVTRVASAQRCEMVKQFSPDRVHEIDGRSQSPARRCTAMGACSPLSDVNWRAPIALIPHRPELIRSGSRRVLDRETV
jgi:hypothetical protein